jgi:predicted PurR-regulated permease PerM
MAAMPPDTPRMVRIPRWVQLVGLPLILVGAWQFMSAVSHAMFIFVVAALIAILLNPIVRAFCALKIPRALAVFLVYLTFAITFVALGVLAGTVIATQVQSASTVVENEFSTAPGQTETPAEMRLDDLQQWLDDHGLSQVNVRQLGDKVQQKVNSLDIESVSGQAVGVAQGVLLGVAESLFNVVLVIVVSVYMLLDAPRLSRFLRRLFPPAEGEDDLVVRLERALLSYVRGQTLVSLVIGATAGGLMWILGELGIFQGGSDYAIAFGAFAALTEVIPYVGPWIGAIPPMAVALAESPTAAIAVALAFLFIHQVEGHIVIPKLMGGAVGVHPLLVIFALLAGQQLYGFAGVFVTLPLLAVGRELFRFLRERIGLEPWGNGPVPVEVPVEVHGPVPQPPPTVPPGGGGATAGS